MIVLDLSILNQKGTPMFNSDTFANRPAFGIVGRIFISTDTKEFYRDTGTSWELLGGPGAGTITGSGAAGQVTYFTGASSVAGSNNLFWDVANSRLGIGTNVPSFELEIIKNGFPQINVFSSNGSLAAYRLQSSNQTASFGIGNLFGANPSAALYTISNIPISFATNSIANARLFTTGNLVLQNGGTFTDNGQRLQVQGTTLLNGQVDVGGDIRNNSPFTYSIGTSASPFATINAVNFISPSNAFIVGAGNCTLQAGNISGLQVFASTRNVSIQNGGTFTDLGQRLQVQGTSYFSDRMALGSNSAIATRGISNRLPLSGSSALVVGYELESGIANTVTGEVRGYSTFITQQTGGNLGRLAHYWVSAQSTFGGTITNQYGLFIEAGTIGATNNYGIYSEIPSGTNRWNLYMQGTANNYMAGNLLIKTTTDTGYSAQITGTGDNMLSVWGASAPSIRLDNAASGASRRFVIGLATATNNFIQGAVANDACITTASSNPLLFGMWVSTSATEVMRISTALNLQIGSITDTGEKFQLTGSIRVNGQRSASAGGSSGQHLIINCDGVSYKIALLNP